VLQEDTAKCACYPWIATESHGGTGHIAEPLRLAADPAIPNETSVEVATL